MVICLAEDRKSFEPALKLLLLSLAQHCAAAIVELFYPIADAAFETWLRRCPQVRLNHEPLPGAQGWNVKPHALLALLEKGYEQAIWIDSDIIVTHDFWPIIAVVPPEVLVVAEEALCGSRRDPDGLRARAWGLPVGRDLPFAANTAIIRATKYHVALLQEWRRLLESEEYKRAQGRGWSLRPVHMLSDQDVLTALVTSRRFASTPIRFLRRGRDIIQYKEPYGYTCWERAFHALRGLPPFVHSQGLKPWVLRCGPDRGRRLRDQFDLLYSDLSPYTIQARKFRTELRTDTSWMSGSGRLSLLLRNAGFSWTPLVGLPLAILADLVWISRAIVRGARGLRHTALPGRSPQQTSH